MNIIKYLKEMLKRREEKRRQRDLSAAQASFAAVVSRGGRVLIAKAGWIELCPDENCLRFRHDDFPEVEVCWNPQTQQVHAENYVNQQEYFRGKDGIWRELQH